MHDNFVEFAAAERRSDPGTEPAVHEPVLTSLLRMAGADMHVALLEQLVADLVRLDRELAADDPDAVARAAHEAKGLGATIGAQRLAQLAQNLNSLAPRLGLAGMAAMATTVRLELGAVLVILRQRLET
jgi:HPt (histidine-containing phosphotransfer) domain-containing protein